MSSNIVITGSLVLASMTFTVVGNLLLKVGSGERGVGTVWPFNLLNMT